METKEKGLQFALNKRKWITYMKNKKELPVFTVQVNSLFLFVLFNSAEASFVSLLPVSMLWTGQEHSQRWAPCQRYQQQGYARPNTSSSNEWSVGLVSSRPCLSTHKCWG